MLFELPVCVHLSHMLLLQVEEIFERYCNELLLIFNQNKDSCLPVDVAARGLTIVRQKQIASSTGQRALAKF